MAEARQAQRSVLDFKLLNAVPLLLAIFAAVALTAPAAAQSLREADVADLITRSKLGASRVGVSIVDLRSGKPLVQIRDTEPFIPASNMKLVTSGAAVAVLGPDFEFRTTLWRIGNRLVVEGAGDPAFADPELLSAMGKDATIFVNTLAEAVAQAWSADGDAIGGPITEVIVDDRVLDRDYVHPRWPANQLGLWYCAGVGGLNFHANVIRLFAQPSEQEGTAPRIRTEPSAPWLSVENRARTAKKDESTTLDLARVPGANTFILRGTIRASLFKPLEATVQEPSLIFARLLAERLGQARLGPGGGVPSWRLVGEDEDLSSEPRRALAVVRTPLSVVLERCNGDSHNLYAEALIKRIGHEITKQPGGWSNGAAVIRMQLRDRVGPEAAAAVTISDGSGLSRDNLISPAIMTEWLGVLLADARLRDGFLASIPRAGVEGNMVRRFRGRDLVSEVRCKSGYINGVRCLSGYVIDRASGRAVAFSILVNEIPPSIPGARVKDFHEDIVVMIDRWLEAQAGRGAAARTRAAPPPGSRPAARR